MTDKPRRLGSKKEYADLNGWTKAYLSKADVKERLAGAMVIDTADGKKKLDFDKADEIFAATADPARQKKKNTKKKSGSDMPAEETAAVDTNVAADATTPQDSFHAIKTDRERIKLKEEQLAYQQRVGNTLSKAEVRNALLKSARVLQEKLKARNRRMAEQLKTISDHLVILTMLNTSDREILEELSNGIIEQLEFTRSAPDPTD